MRTKIPASPFLNITYLRFEDLTMQHSKCTNGNRYVNFGKHGRILFIERYESHMIVFTMRWEILKTIGLWINENRPQTNTKLEKTKQNKTKSYKSS